MAEYTVIDFLLELTNDGIDKKILESIKNDLSKEEILEKLLKYMENDIDD